MTPRNNLTTQSIFSAPSGKQMLQGAGIAFILITVFLLQTGTPDPEWAKLWMIKPLLIVPLAGAAGGAFYSLTGRLCYQGGWKKILVTLLSLVVYITGLWLGTVLGLDGTMWN